MLSVTHSEAENLEAIDGTEYPLRVELRKGRVCLSHSASKGFESLNEAIRLFGMRATVVLATAVLALAILPGCPGGGGSEGGDPLPTSRPLNVTCVAPDRPMPTGVPRTGF